MYSANLILARIGAPKLLSYRTSSVDFSQNWFTLKEKHSTQA
jgi:hypothetical protein